jgi:hypothetical protein
VKRRFADPKIERRRLESAAIRLANKYKVSIWHSDPAVREAAIVEGCKRYAPAQTARIANNLALIERYAGDWGAAQLDIAWRTS